MGEAYFYHLTDLSAVDTLRMLLPRAMQAGWRVEVRGQDAGAMDKLDEALWIEPKDSFLPHARAGGPHDGDQPVLLTVGGDHALGGAEACIMTVGGAEVTPQEVQAAARVCVLFDGLDETALERARGQWRALTGAGVAAQYWARDGGAWVKKAESAA